MLDKRCVHCKEVKNSDTDFAFRNTAKGIKHTTCKACHVKMQKDYYSRNSQYYKDKAKQNPVNFNPTLFDFFEVDRTIECSICGEDHPSALSIRAFDPERSQYQCLNDLKKGVKSFTVICLNCGVKNKWVT
jgi:hypothetical protein